MPTPRTDLSPDDGQLPDGYVVDGNKVRRDPEPVRRVHGKDYSIGIHMATVVRLELLFEEKPILARLGARQYAAIAGRLVPYERTDPEPGVPDARGLLGERLVEPADEDDLIEFVYDA